MLDNRREMSSQAHASGNVLDLDILGNQVSILEWVLGAEYAPNEVARVLELMASGARLRISHGQEEGELRDDGLADEPSTAKPVSAAVVKFLLASNQIMKIEKFRSEGRAGWLDAGHDGNIADWYALTQ